VRDVLWPVLGLRKGGVAVDVGCGGGALTRALARWLGPGCTVYGIDRDANFLEYARRRAREERLSRRTRYLEGDALSLPLPDGIADAVTSYTVAEHVPDPRRFAQEQIRVCRRGGRVSIMQASGKCVRSSPTRSSAPSRRERELWKPLERAFERHIHRRWGVGAQDTGVDGFRSIFEEMGLCEIMLDGFAVTHSLDDARISKEEALQWLQTQEEWILDGVDRCAALLARPLPAGHLASLRRCIQARFRKQRRCIETGVRTWEFRVSLSWVVSGRVP
jgi:SAM-dependent methyltransferase